MEKDLTAALTARDGKYAFAAAERPVTGIFRCNSIILCYTDMDQRHNRAKARGKEGYYENRHRH